MKYVIFDKDSEELVDIVDFSDIEKIKYEKNNPNHYLELEDDLLGELVDDDDFDDNFDEDFEDDEFGL